MRMPKSTASEVKCPKMFILISFNVINTNSTFHRKCNFGIIIMGVLICVLLRTFLEFKHSKNDDSSFNWNTFGKMAWTLTYGNMAFYPVFWSKHSLWVKKETIVFEWVGPFFVLFIWEIKRFTYYYMYMDDANEAKNRFGLDPHNRLSSDCSTANRRLRTKQNGIYIWSFRLKREWNRIFFI